MVGEKTKQSINYWCTNGKGKDTAKLLEENTNFIFFTLNKNSNTIPLFMLHHILNNKDYFLDGYEVIHEFNIDHTFRCNIASKLFDYYCSSNNLVKCILSDSDIYYVGNGIIFNSNLEPLLMVSYPYHITEDREIIREPSLIINISPDVFIHKHRLEKYILKSLLPYLSTTSMWVPTLGYIKGSIIIEDFKSKFKYPDINNTINENNLLQHIDKIMETMYEQ